ncbi:MAG: type II toxin-antitoxin system HicA family toxin [Dehalococcoidia bacterium]
MVRLLGSLGYDVVRQRGSHVRLRKSTVTGEHKPTVTTPGFQIVTN